MLSEAALRRGIEVAHGDLPSLRGWFPVTLDANPAVLWWRHLGERRFTEPFFVDTLARQASPERRVCRTPLSALRDLPDSVPPTAFIFHVSRCGSTLLTQMLATLSTCTVMSEPPVLDAFFRLHHHRPEQSGGIETLRGLVAALGQRRRADEKHLVIKFDCWHMPWMPFVREAFPGTPIVLLQRDPAQVLASHRRQRGPQMVPGLLDTSRLRIDASGLAPGDLDGYSVRVLDAILCEASMAIPAARPLVLDYARLPDALWTDLMPAWGVTISPAESQAMQARSRLHAKHANTPFEGDAVEGAGQSAARANVTT